MKYLKLFEQFLNEDWSTELNDFLKSNGRNLEDKGDKLTSEDIENFVSSFEEKYKTGADFEEMVNTVKHSLGFEDANESQNNALASKVMAVATKEQKEVIEEFQSGTEYLFLMSPSLKGAVSAEAIDDALQMMVNSVEGDTSQLDPKHVEYATAKGWLEGWED